MITSKRKRRSNGLESRSSSRTLRPTLLLLLAVPLLAFSMTALAQHKHPISENFVDGGPAVADELIVKFRPNAGRHAIAVSVRVVRGRAHVSSSVVPACPGVGFSSGSPS